MTVIILIILTLISSCDEPLTTGCTSPSACNFDPDADKADGSCIEPSGCNNWCDGMEGAPSDLDCNGQCCDPLENKVWNTNIRPYVLTNAECMEVDDCNNCGGTCILNNLESCDDIDCTGQCGNATVDQCGTCDSAPTNDCEQDCLQNYGGNASIDNCGICAGGDTGLEPNYLQDCHGDCFGFASIDDCGVCTGGNTGFNPNLSLIHI